MSCYTEFVQDILLGIKSSIPHNNGIKLVDEGYIITPFNINLQEGKKEIEVNLQFRVQHNSLLPTPLEDSIHGSGKSIEQALGNAVRLWVEGTLPVLHYLHHGPKELSKVTKIAFSSQEDDRAHNFDLICGPLQNDTKLAKSIESPENESQIIEALQGPLSSHLTAEGTLCIVAHVSKNGKDIKSSCTINNKEWSEGSEALYYWADRWGVCNPPKIQKQFFICIPQNN